MNKTIAVVSLAFLSGCATYQENFDCPVGEGVRCASLSTINAKMDKNEIQMEVEEPHKDTTYFGSDFRTGGVY